MREEVTGLPIPLPNATSPLKRGTCVFWWLSRGGGNRMVPFRSPLGLLPEPGEVHLATLLTWAGRWAWLFPWPACSPGGLRRPLLSPLSQA